MSSKPKNSLTSDLIAFTFAQLNFLVPTFSLKGYLIIRQQLTSTNRIITRPWRFTPACFFFCIIELNWTLFYGEPLESLVVYFSCLALFIDRIRTYSKRWCCVHWTLIAINSTSWVLTIECNRRKIIISFNVYIISSFWTFPLYLQTGDCFLSWAWELRLNIRLRK